MGIRLLALSFFAILSDGIYATTSGRKMGGRKIVTTVGQIIIATVRALTSRTTGMTEGEELTQRKSNAVDRALRVHPIVRRTLCIHLGEAESPTSIVTIPMIPYKNGLQAISNLCKKKMVGMSGMNNTISALGGVISCMI